MAPDASKKDHVLVLPTAPCRGVEEWARARCGGEAIWNIAWRRLVHLKKPKGGVRLEQRKAMAINPTARRTMHQVGDAEAGRVAGHAVTSASVRTLTWQNGMPPHLPPAVPSSVDRHRPTPFPHPTNSQMHVHVADVDSGLAAFLYSLKPEATGWTYATCKGHPMKCAASPNPTRFAARCRGVKEGQGPAAAAPFRAVYGSQPYQARDVAQASALVWSPRNRVFCIVQAADRPVRCCLLVTSHGGWVGRQALGVCVLGRQRACF